ncbi:MAG: hypothetical protein IT258_11255 [Saprospiraceae bacterium]|nr:hypothetical protein [Saprospiraceae bacterium]
MSTKIVLQTFILIASIILTSCSKKADSFNRVGHNTFICIRAEDGSEICCLYQQLYKITAYSVEDLSIGRDDRTSYITQRRLLNEVELDKIKSTSDFYPVGHKIDSSQILLFISENLSPSGLFKLENIPQQFRGDVIKHLWNNKKIVVFKEYQGDFFIHSR